MTTHTPELWTLHDLAIPTRQQIESGGIGILMLGHDGSDQGRAYAAHAVDCVNGCAGLDPAGYRACVDALENLVICPAFSGQVFEKDKESQRAWTLARAALELAKDEPSPHLAKQTSFAALARRTS